MGKRVDIKRIINRKIRRPSDIPQLIDMDIDTFNKLDTKDLKKVVKILSKEANRRMNEIFKAGKTTPATRKAMNSGGWFTSNVKPKSNNTELNAQRSAYMRVRAYLQSETSTLSGYNKIKDEVIDTLAVRWGIYVSEDNYDDVWKIYDKLVETNPRAANMDLKYRVINKINEMLKEEKRRNIEDFIDELRDAMTDIYEEYIEEVNNGQGVSDFFKGFNNL